MVIWRLWGNVWQVDTFEDYFIAQLVYIAFMVAVLSVISIAWLFIWGTYRIMKLAFTSPPIGVPVLLAYLLLLGLVGHSLLSPSTTLAIGDSSNPPAQATQAATEAQSSGFVPYWVSGGAPAFASGTGASADARSTRVAQAHRTPFLSDMSDSGKARSDYGQLKTRLATGRLKRDEPLAQYTTFRIGGPAEDRRAEAFAARLDRGTASVRHWLRVHGLRTSATVQRWPRFSEDFSTTLNTRFDGPRTPCDPSAREPSAIHAKYPFVRPRVPRDGAGALHPPRSDRRRRRQLPRHGPRAG